MKDGSKLFFVCVPSFFVTLKKNNEELMMYNCKILSSQNLGNFDFDKTKKKINNYFKTLEKIEWEWAKLNAQKGMTANYDFSAEYKKQPYIPICEDSFNISAKENKEEQLKRYMYSYYWAISTLSDNEHLYIKECFINRKYETEIVDLLGFSSSDSNEFRKLKRSAVFKFADFLNFVVEKDVKVKSLV